MSAPSVNGKLREPTEEQWEAIRRCDEHLLVAASAGTGKTFTVVRKLLYLMGVETRGQVVAAPLRLRDLAAITYTNKAAAELKQRLRDDLRTVGRRGDAYEVDTARVGTIHSFCGDVLREFALRAGRSPALSLLDDAKGQRLAGECVRDTLLACLEEDGVPGLTALLTERSVGDVEGWTRQLLAQGDHLRRLSARAGTFGAHERVLVALAERSRDALERRLVQEGAMDFDRMITWTRDLLRDDAVVRKALQRRIRVLVIDEFQDVDPVQKEIAWLLGDPDSRRADTTRLVLVGDPKQSIYRFRKADVTVWRTVEDSFAASRSGAVVPLSRSHRSVPDVLGFVDHAVGTLLDTPIDGEALALFEVPYAAVTTTRPDAPAHAGVELLCIAPKDDGKCQAAPVVRQAEAAEVARRVRALHDERGLKWGDVALLLTGWGAVDTYVDALRALDIPTYALRGEGYWERREVLDCLVALEALRNPLERRWLFGFLRSPMVGLADESLLSLVRARSDVWFRRGEIVLADPDEQARWARGVALLERWAVLRDRVGVAELLEIILDDTGYCAHLELLNGADARQRIGNVRKLVRLAAEEAEDTVGDFLARVREQRDLEVREGDARLYGEGDDVVTVTSVHSAKGLEWGVVFWCDLVRGKKDDSSKLLVGREAVILGEPEKKREEQSGEWQALFAELAREREAEAKRLWYVAATRARDLLVLSGIALGDSKPDASAVSGMLRTNFPGLGGSDTVAFTARGGVTHASRLSVIAVPEHEDETSVVRPEPLDASTLSAPHEPLVVAQGSQRSSATQLMSRERCGRRHWMKYLLGLREPKPVFAPAGTGANADGLSAIERGLVVHDVMERWEREADLGALVEDALERNAGDAPDGASAGGRRLRRSIEEEVGSLVARPQVRALLDHPDGRRELGFLMVEPDGMAYEGAIDLIAPVEDGYHVVDVKTSRCDAAQAQGKAAGYRRQRDLYASTVEGIAGDPVRRFLFAFSAADTVVELSPELIQPPLPETAAMASDASECRFCGYRTAGWCVGVAATAAASVEA